MTMLEFGPSSERMVSLISGLSDDQLGLPTPCSTYTVGDLLDHVAGLTMAFRGAAAKTNGPTTTAPPVGDAANLDADWRDSIPRRVRELGAAWQAPDAWSGMTRVGGIDLPGEVAGLVGLQELVTHGWDLARATGSPYACETATLEALYEMAQQFSGPGKQDARGDAFGPEVDVPADAPMLDRLIGCLGRDPAWSVS